MSIFSRNKPPRVKRTGFNLSHEKVLTTNFGRLTPIYLEEVVPGDKFSVQTELLVKLAPMASPAFSRIDCAIHYFFVPNRLIWDGWERWISGTVDGTTTDQIPTKDNYMPPFPSYAVDLTTTDRRNAHAKGSLFDYLTGSVYSSTSSAALTDMMISRLPFHAYQFVYDEYFRDENVGRLPMINTKDGFSNISYTPLRNMFGLSGNINLTDYPNNYDNIMTNGLLKIQYGCWRKDYFTSALPWTQRGGESKLYIEGTSRIPNDTPINIVDSNIVPWGGTGSQQGGITFSQGGWTTYEGVTSNVIQNPDHPQPWVVQNRSGQTITTDGTIKNAQTSGTLYSNAPSYTEAELNPRKNLNYDSNLKVDGTETHRHQIAAGQGFPIQQFAVTHTNISGKLNTTSPESLVGAVTGSISVNDVRRAFQLQRWLERTARGGYRYIEQILSHFGVYSSDKRLDRPEHLGGGKVPVVVGDIYQTSDNSKTSGGTNTGNRAGHGNAYGSAAGFKNKHIEEHGYIMGVLIARPRSVYMNGIDRTFIKGANGDRFDFYWPEFAHIGEQPIYNAELALMTGQGTNNLGAFGYTPRYHEYRYHRSTIHGDFRDSLAFWHQGRDFGTTMPTLNSTFLECSDATNYRPFYDTTSATDHLWCFMTNHVKALRPIPRFSDPGYADH